ncbi:hypothetical protein PoB_005703100 [Plakobranchus ocellatus]|uniref:Uncharacterized protein n=1 Tax=Plakobranchus ocellatus TaxID=259542 RepID=A0AAV4CGL3_9GAST|nr:hypothetical protein PoB_005703100 [Plakobranchus ocellatus]
MSWRMMETASRVRRATLLRPALIRRRFTYLCRTYTYSVEDVKDEVAESGNSGYGDDDDDADRMVMIGMATFTTSWTACWCLEKDKPAAVKVGRQR